MNDCDANSIKEVETEQQMKEQSIIHKMDISGVITESVFNKPIPVRELIHVYALSHPDLRNTW